MGWEWTAGLITFAFATSVTPGPNNMMLLASGVNFGFRRTLPHMLGIACGVSTLLAAMALGLGLLFALYPPLSLVLKIAGGGYLLWLAYKIATSTGPGSASGPARPMNFIEAAAFQWVNPKAWMMALGAIAGYFPAASHWSVAVLLIALFWVTGMISITPWAAFGQAVRHLLADPVRLTWFNRAMGAALALSVWPMVR